RALRQGCDGDGGAMADEIASIVARCGKLQNPLTGSGGVLMGKLSHVGPRYSGAGIALGQRVVPLASLVATPLRLDTVGPVDPSDPQVRVSGRAIVTGRMSCAVVPDDLSLDVVLTALDVYPAASHTRRLARPGAHVLVIGCGHAGLAALVAARDQLGQSGRVTVVDTREAALDQACAIYPRAARILADATRPAEVAGCLSSLGLAPADLTVLCTTVPGCEGAAILLTGDEGTVLFFSTATSFPAAGLGADALSSRATLSIPNGYTADEGGYLMDLLRRNEGLLRAYRRS
ncbi:MAG: L-erythro-3,5-diaminohexanoate dehydrogenase, partial [Acidimicrobiales bacterium]